MSDTERKRSEVRRFISKIMSLFGGSAILFFAGTAYLANDAYNQAHHDFKRLLDDYKELTTEHKKLREEHLEFLRQSTDELKESTGMIRQTQDDMKRCFDVIDFQKVAIERYERRQELQTQYIRDLQDEVTAQIAETITCVDLLTESRETQFLHEERSRELQSDLTTCVDVLRVSEFMAYPEEPLKPNGQFDLSVSELRDAARTLGKRPERCFAKIEDAALATKWEDP